MPDVRADGEMRRERNFVLVSLAEQRIFRVRRILSGNFPAHRFAESDFVRRAAFCRFV